MVRGVHEVACTLFKGEKVPTSDEDADLDEDDDDSDDGDEEKSPLDDAELVERRKGQLAECVELIAATEGKLDAIRKQFASYDLLSSVADGIYEEVDKVNKKAPVDEITKLVCNEINQLIGDVKVLASSDAYVQRLDKFVPAGQNPQNRDAVIVLQLVRKGLERLRATLEKLRLGEQRRYSSLSTIKAAIDYWFEANGARLSLPAAAKRMRAHPDRGWFEEPYEGRGYYFDFDELDDLDALTPYFSLAKDDAPGEGEDE